MEYKRIVEIRNIAFNDNNSYFNIVSLPMGDNEIIDKIDFDIQINNTNYITDFSQLYYVCRFTFQDKNQLATNILNIIPSSLPQTHNIMFCYLDKYNKTKNLNLKIKDNITLSLTTEFFIFPKDLINPSQFAVNVKIYIR